MPSWLEVAIAAAVVVAFFVCLSYVRRRLVLNITVQVEDKVTRVFGPGGEQILELPSTLRYVEGPAGNSIIGFGDDVVEDAPAQDATVLHLARPLSDIPPDLRDAWGAYIVYCSQKARRQLSLRPWSLMEIAVAARTSEPEANELLRTQARGRRLRIIGAVRPS